MAARKNNGALVGTALGVGLIALILLGGRDAKARIQVPEGDDDKGGGGGKAPKKPKGPKKPKKPKAKKPKKPTSGGTRTNPGGSGSSGKRTNPGGGGPPGPDAGGGKRTNPGGGGGSRTNPDGGDGGKRTNPPAPVGPNPGPDELDPYYNPDWPDPLTFYQVRQGDIPFRVARRWYGTMLYLAALEGGGMDDDAALAWAKARTPSGSFGGKRDRDALSVILCVGWNDLLYGSYRVGSDNLRGPHGKGIDYLPQHPANWALAMQGESMASNVFLHTPGEVGKPDNAGKGDKKYPLLWMPKLDTAALFESDGKLYPDGDPIPAESGWGDGSSFYWPPPIVADRGIDDLTNSRSLGVWGCGEGKLNT